MLLGSESALDFSRPEAVTLELLRDRVSRVLVLVDLEREVTSVELVVLDRLTFSEVSLFSLTQSRDIQSGAIREIRDGANETHGEQVILEHTRDVTRIDLCPDKMFVSESSEPTSHLYYSLVENTKCVPVAVIEGIA